MQKLLLALVTVGVVALGALFLARGPQARLAGEITEVRTLEVEPEACVAFVNFRVENITQHPFIAHDRRLEVIDARGDRRLGRIVLGPDLQDLFKYFPEIGGMKDEPLLYQGRVEPGEKRGALIAARFEIPVASLQARKQLRLRLVDGANRPTEILESPE